MATICNLSVPLEEFVLAETFETCPDAIVECEQLVEHPHTTVLALIWVRETSPAAFEAALDQDATVEAYTQLAGTDTEWFYEMTWTARALLAVWLLITEGALLLTIVGDRTGWHLRVLFPAHDDVRATTDFCATYNFPLTIHDIHHFDTDNTSSGTARFGLTAAQREGLIHAYKRGYFEVPRALDLDTLASELGISHQAFSERLRRAHETLIRETLLVGTEPTATDHPAVDSAAPSDKDDPPAGDI